jgi:hypothetical protein
MGYEPITCCRYCGEAFDAYVPIEDRICDSCKEVTPTLERAELGVDGNAGFALLGGDLQIGEAEFVEIALPIEASKDPHRYHDSEWCAAAKRATNLAFQKLKARLNGKAISYYLGRSYPDTV